MKDIVLVISLASSKLSGCPINLNNQNLLFTIQTIAIKANLALDIHAGL